MALITLTSAVAGDTIEAAFWNAELAKIINQLNGNIEAVNIATNAVTSVKILASAVTTVKINNEAVTFPKLSTALALDEDDMASDSATAIATQQSIKAYVDTYTQFGTWVDKSAAYGAQQATTDGIIFGSLSDDSSTYLVEFFTDGNADPTTKVAQLGSASSFNSSSNKRLILVPVNRDNYWKMVLTTGTPTINYLWFIPTGA